MKKITIANDPITRLEGVNQFLYDECHLETKERLYIDIIDRRNGELLAEIDIKNKHITFSDKEAKKVVEVATINALVNSGFTTTISADIKSK